MAKKNDKPLLELSTHLDREFLTIDDNKYYVRSKPELSFADYHKVIKWGRRTSTLIRQDDLSAEELNEYQNSLDDCIKLILIDLPAEVLKGIPEGQKRDIMEAFTKLLTAGMSEGEIATAEKLATEEIATTQ